MHISRLTTLLTLAACLLTSAQAANPALTNIVPRGGQRGQETAVTFYGERLQEIQKVLFYGKGIPQKISNPPKTAKH